ncbi:MAG: hypothetical protein OES25_17295, partial [Acidobacteriota bacterium]|nr:hypothetical protein [Acidobacteriota bacterium]
MRIPTGSRFDFAILALAICSVVSPVLGDEVILDWDIDLAQSSQEARVDAAGNVYSVTGVNLLKIDLDGNVLWTRALDTVGGYVYVGGRLAIDPDGNVLVIGTNWLVEPNALLTLKFDPDGNLLWESVMSTTSGPRRVETDAAGNVYVLAQTNSSLEDFVTGKYDPDGNLLWRNVFVGGVINEPSHLAVTPDGVVAVVGRSNVVGNSYDTSVVVYETDGTQRWWRNHTSTSSGGGSDRGTGVAFGPAGEVYVGGSCEHADADWDATLIKYDADGNEQWVRHHNFNPGPNSYDSIIWVGVDSSGDVLAAGQGDSGDIVAFKYDADGNQLWVRQHDGGDGGYNYLLYMVVGPYDDAMYLSGVNTLNKTLAIKYDTAGNLRWTYLHTYGGFTTYYGTSIAIDPGNNVVLGKYGRPVQHLLQSDCALGPPAEVHRVRMGPDRVYWTPGHNGEQYEVDSG